MPQYNIKQVKGSTQGSVLFLGSNGVVTENNSKLYWDNTNNKLGVGTQSGTNHLYVYSSAGVSGYDLIRVQNSVSTFVVNDAGYASYTGNSGLRVIGSNGRIDVISAGGIEPGINWYYNSGSTIQGSLYGQNNSMLFTMPSSTAGLGIGAILYTPSAMLSVRGVTSGTSFKVQSYIGEEIFNVKNSGYVSIGTSSNNSVIFQVSDRLTPDSTRKVINVIDSLGSELVSLSRNTFSMSTSNQRIYSLSGVLDIQYIMGQGSMTWYNTTYGSETLRLTLDASPIFSSTFQNAIRFDSFVGIGMTGVNLPSTKLHVYATQSGAFRLQDTTQAAGYVLTSDANGVGTWQPVSSSGGASANNGLSVVAGYIGMGGTLSRDTLVTNGTYAFTMSSTASTINFERKATLSGYTNSVYLAAGESSLKSTNASEISKVWTNTAGGLYARIESSDTTSFNTYVQSSVTNLQLQATDIANGPYNNITLYNSTQTGGDGSTDNTMFITDTLGNKGLVYASDYTANFTTYSLITKGYVTSVMSGSAFKTVDTRSFTASIAETITHNLNTSDVIVQNYDSTGVQIIADTVTVLGTGSISVEFSQNLTSVKTVIMG